MNRHLIFLLLIFGIALESHAQVSDNHDAIKKSIVVFFDGLAKFDEAAMRGELTDDFQLLEDGLVWNADSLMAALKQVNRTAFSRANAFKFLNVEQRGDVAWVSYFNDAVITRGEHQFQLKWLESAVLVKSQNRWQIAFLHSTRMKE